MNFPSWSKFIVKIFIHNDYSWLLIKREWRIKTRTGELRGHRSEIRIPHRIQWGDQQICLPICPPIYPSLSFIYVYILCIYDILFPHFLSKLQISNGSPKVLQTHKTAGEMGHTCPIFWIWGCISELLTSQQCLAFYRGNLNPDNVASLLPESLSILQHLHYLSGKRLSEALMEAFWGTSWTVARKRKWISCWVNWG